MIASLLVGADFSIFLDFFSHLHNRPDYNFLEFPSVLWLN